MTDRPDRPENEQLREQLHELADRIADRAVQFRVNVHNDIEAEENWSTGTMDHQYTGERTLTVWWKESV